MHVFENGVPPLSPKDLFKSVWFFSKSPIHDQFRIYNPARVYAKTCTNVPSFNPTPKWRFWWYRGHGLNFLHYGWSSYPWQGYLKPFNLSSESDMTVSQNMRKTALGQGMMRLHLRGPAAVPIYVKNHRPHLSLVTPLGKTPNLLSISTSTIIINNLQLPPTPSELQQLPDKNILWAGVDGSMKNCVLAMWAMAGPFSTFPDHQVDCHQKNCEQLHA